jgi:hypothetical protein
VAKIIDASTDLSHDLVPVREALHDASFGFLFLHLFLGLMHVVRLLELHDDVYLLVWDLQHN